MATTKITSNPTKVDISVKPRKVDVTLSRVGPQGLPGDITESVLSDLSNVDLTGASIGDGIVLDSDNNWVPHTFSTTSLADIDNSNQENGSILIFSDTTEKYTASNTIENNMTIKGGTF